MSLPVKGFEDVDNRLFEMENMTNRFYEGYNGGDHSHNFNGPNFLNAVNFSWITENRYYNTNMEDDIGSTNILLPTPGDGSGGDGGYLGLGWGDLALVSLFCSIIAGTVAGNTLVIAAVITTRRLRTVTNCFVMSLAVADWLVGMFVMPPKVALYLVHNEWRLGGFFCEVWIALDILLCTASILSLCAISIDRYLAITRPLAYSRRRRSKRLALSMISCVWVAAAIITSPPIFGWYDETRNNENNCTYNENTGYVVYSALGSFFLPLLVMLYVYARIACVIARRQHTIQKLSNSSDKKTHCCGGSDVEEPLRGHGKESFERGDVRVNTEMDTKYHEQQHRNSPTEDDETQQQLDAKSVIEARTSGGGDTAIKSKFWGLFHLRSCTSSGDDDSQSGNGTKRSSSGGQKSVIGSSDSDSNSASGMALSLPDPATLSGVVESTINENTLSRSACSSPRCCNQSGCTNQAPHVHLQSHHAISRTRTGSRLCHHSIATTSPQRNIHRVHQTASSTTRLYLDHELVPLEESKTISKSAPRVWTVEETTSNTSLITGTGGRQKSPNGRTASLKQERNGRNNGRFNSSGTIMQTTLSVPMNNSPAGNPASLMSSQNVATGELSTSHNSTGANRSSNRIYHPQPGNHFHHNHHNLTPNHMSSMMHRGRSIKLTLNVHGNDHNQNGSNIARDFAGSSRVASFKRETKTAQTLAAVVGGFIICWPSILGGWFVVPLKVVRSTLPFFVAYVIGPFIPPDIIPTALMDALIWLGWSNSTINPFIYAFYSPDFRSAFWRLTVRKCGNLIGYHRDNERRSPRRFDDHNHTQSRVSS